MIGALYSPDRYKVSISPEITNAHKGSFDKAVDVSVCVSAKWGLAVQVSDPLNSPQLSPAACKT